MVKHIHNSVRAWQAILDRLTICADDEAEHLLFQELAALKKPCVLSFVNAHAANLAWQEEAFLDYIMASDVIVRDGVGMHLLLALLGREAGVNLNGTDLIPEFLSSLPRDTSLAIYGTQDPYLSAGVARLQSMGFETVHAEHGFHEDEYYVGRFVEAQPVVVVLAMGMPKQERIASLLRHVSFETGRSALIINGGAIVDFMSNRFPRAPLWMRKRGIEWVYRLTREPKRLWRRNVGNLIFILRALLMTAFIRRKNSAKSSKE
ncbi:MAG: WecB/TagA/CpsF family glycosyltransferase [Chlorobiales bacterium]|nr:WecB/TagA/CpsF family glycosyltransferase [Chlorobiales bacterium]